MFTINLIFSAAIFLQAEKDSTARKKQVESVCRNLNISKILGPLKRMDKKTMGRRKILHKRLIVNEEHKVIYCIVPKVGCTQLKRIFLVLNGVYSSIEEVTDIHDMTKHTYVFDKKFSDKKREYMLKNFYKFIIVRDPLERLVSAYRNKFEGKTMQFMPPWKLKIAKEIVKRYRYNNEEIDLHKVNNVTFPEYIHHIIDTPSLKLNAHWMPYRDLCRPCEIHYDFIGSMDTYMRDVKHIMRQIKADETKFYVYGKNRTTLIGTKKSTASFYKVLPKKHFDRLVKMFKLDHELFGYSLPELKSLDKRYQSK